MGTDGAEGQGSDLGAVQPFDFPDGGGESLSMRFAGWALWREGQALESHPGKVLNGDFATATAWEGPPFLPSPLLCPTQAPSLLLPHPHPSPGRQQAWMAEGQAPLPQRRSLLDEFE